MKLISKIFSRIRKGWYVWWNLLHVLGLDKTFYRNARGSRILVYHGVCLTDPFRFNTLYITKRRFEEHLKFYKKHFHIVSLEEFFAGHFNPEKFNICLTFDDGFANNYHHVLPLLEKYEVPATFFVTAIREAGYDILWNDFMSITGKYGPDRLDFNREIFTKNKRKKYVTSAGKQLTEMLRSSGFRQKEQLMEQLGPTVSFRDHQPDEEYWLQMSARQIRAVSASPYATIGAHGFYHNDLSRIDPADAFHEMEATKTYLENMTGKPVNSFAFPYGAYHPLNVIAAKALGYKYLLATDFQKPEDQNDASLRERLTINPFLSTAPQMYATIRGGYE